MSVVNWATASAEWTPEGFGLTLELTPAATERHAVALAEHLDVALAPLFGQNPFAVVGFEPSDGQPAQLTITSAALMSVDPRALHYTVDGVAAQVFAHVDATAASERFYLDQWLGALRG